MNKPGYPVYVGWSVLSIPYCGIECAKALKGRNMLA